MKLQTIREALAAQLQNLERSPTVFAYDPESRSGHNITVLPAVAYAVPKTIGSNWDADIELDLRIEVPGRLADAQIAMDDYLSAGVGSTSSVIDAVLADGKLGGAVEDAFWLGTDAPNLDTDPITVLVHFRFMIFGG